MISVLLPSRGRPELLRDSLRSLQDRAESPKRLEVLVRLDEDDTARCDYPYDDAEFGSVDVRYLIGPRHGYAGLHLYYNELAQAAVGDWFLLWNDDASITTANWDIYVLEHSTGGPFVLNFTAVPQEGGMNLFPCLNRAFYQAIGHISLSPAIDTWIQDVSRSVGCEVDDPRVGVRHDRRRDETGALAQAGAVAKAAEFYAADMQARLAADIALVREAMGCVAR